MAGRKVPIVPREATRTGFPPDPHQPRKGEMYVVSGVVTLLAVLLLWGGSSFDEETAVVLGEVAPGKLLDREAVPPGAFVTVKGRPDAERVGPVYSRRPSREFEVLVALQEAPTVVLYVQPGHPLNDAARAAALPAAGHPEPEAAPALDAEWTVTGRVYDSESSVAPQADFPGGAVQEFAAEKLGIKPEENVRVLAVGVTPEDVRASARNARRFSVGLGVVAAVLWVLTIWSTARDRRRRLEWSRT